MKVFLVIVAAVLAVACGEKPQTAGTTAGTGKKGDTQSWQGTDNGYAVGGWKAGDRVAWEEQLRARIQAQNEYSRVTAR